MPKVSEEHRAARREQIVLAAMRCVAAEGFHKTTMAHVIRESGLSAGAVYSYFRSKDELIAAIADRSLGVVDRIVDELLQTEPLPSLAQMLEFLLGMVLRQAQASGSDITRIAVAAWAEAVRDEAVRERVASKILHMRRRFADLIRAQQQAGRLDPNDDPEQTAQAVLGLIPGFILQRLVLGDVTPESYAGALAALQRSASPSGQASPS